MRPHCNGRGCPLCDTTTASFSFWPSPGEVSQQYTRRVLALDFCEQQKMQVTSEELLTIIAEAIQYGIALTRKTPSEAEGFSGSGSRFAFVEIGE